MHPTTPSSKHDLIFRETSRVLPLQGWLLNVSPLAAAVYVITAASAKNWQAHPSAADVLNLAEPLLQQCWDELHRAGALVLVSDSQDGPRVLLSRYTTEDRFEAAHDGLYAVYDEVLTEWELRRACQSLEHFRGYVTRGRNVLYGAAPDRLVPTSLDWVYGFGAGEESAYTGYMAVRMAEEDVAYGEPIAMPDWWALESHLGEVFASIGTEPEVVLPEIERQITEGEVTGLGHFRPNVPHGFGGQSG